jgi:hypothetical protein
MKDCKIREVHCVATSEWSHLYVGEIELDELTVGMGRDAIMGTIVFPDDSKHTEQIWLLCQYDLARS